MGLTSACASRASILLFSPTSAVGGFCQWNPSELLAFMHNRGSVHDNSSGFLSGNDGGVESFVAAPHLVSASRSAHYESCGSELVAATAAQAA